VKTVNSVSNRKSGNGRTGASNFVVTWMEGVATPDKPKKNP